MSLQQIFALMLDPALLMTCQGLEPDPWQRELLLANDQFLLLNCSRQAGKSTVVAALALRDLLFRPKSLVLMAAPSERQSHELYRKVLAGFHALGSPLKTVRENQSELELVNGARMVALPGREETIRSFSAVGLLIIDEAARVSDDLYGTVRPMLAVSRGRLVALSTPFGQRGWFHRAWTGTGPWRRFHIPWTQCPRIDERFIAEETRALGQSWVDQEYGGIFTSMEGLVYPGFAQAIAAARQPTADPPPHAPRLGGIDFGWRNPFAAVWGFRDEQDILWITDEHYRTETTLLDHAARLPRDVVWHADPASPGDIAQLRRAGLIVKKGDNAIRRGIAQVHGRLQSGRLKVDPRCVNLLAEARLYRYPTAQERTEVQETPIDAHNHALAALRYLIASLDRRSSGVWRVGSGSLEGEEVRCDLKR